MLKKTILALAAAVISSQAFAHGPQNRDDRDGDRPWHLFEQPGQVVVQPGQAALIQVAPRVVYAPTPAPADYSRPTDYSQPADDSPPVFYSQPAQNARLKY